MSQFFIYDCKYFCEDCAGNAIQDLRKEFPRKMTAKDKKEFEQIINDSWDDNTELEDEPLHCESGEDCPNAIHVGDEPVGAWLGNPLTPEGIDRIKSEIRKRQHPFWRLWEEWYGDKLGLKVFIGE